jgi:hypothetical protein
MSSNRFFCFFFVKVSFGIKIVLNRNFLFRTFGYRLHSKLMDEFRGRPK